MDVKQALKRYMGQPTAFRTAFAAFLYLLMATRVFGLLAIESDNLIDLRLFFSRETFFAVIEGQAVTCRDCHLAFHFMDLLFVLTFYPLLAGFARKLCRDTRFFAVSALLAGLMDLTENLGTDLSLLLHPHRHGILAMMVQIATPLKFALLGLALAGSLVMVGLRYLRHRTSG
ncbi:MAG: hypothetical protein PHR90_02510 [Sphaerochaetaceae bacterium]|jgi:hypothetical protein|nr:hypothetical protein [Sphaerochaetaceae bacterium]MDD3941325.1 hypothetical protein [Sphaerochaetaceae bacterium]MDX9940301.1 hypothetical protein [Sphaerochaetaceae bacterium]